MYSTIKDTIGLLFTIDIFILITTNTLLHPFNDLFSRTTWVSQHQKGKPFWILLEKETMGWCASDGPHANHLHLAPDRQPRYTSPLKFFQSGRPSCHPTNSVKALKALSYLLIIKMKLMKDEERMRPGHWMGSVLGVFLQCFHIVGWVTGS